MLVPLVPLGEAVDDDPLDDLRECAGTAVRVAFRGFLVPAVEIPVAPHQGFVNDPPTGTYGLFLLEDDHSVSMAGDEADDHLVWYVMSGTAGEYEECEAPL